MHILVTGGAGYIGSHTAWQLLKAGHKVSILDNLENGHQATLDSIKAQAGEFEFLQVDLRNLEQLRSALAGKRFDCVIHFAAYIDVKLSTQKPEIFFHNNVTGTNNLLMVLLENDIKNVIFSSTAAVYGTPEQVPIPETAPKKPESPYGLSKLLMEDILSTYVEYHKFNVVALRYFNPAGSLDGLIGEKHIPEIHVIPRALHALTDSQFKFGIYGTDYNTPDGTAIRDFIHILDLVDAHIKCIDYLQSNPGFHVFNVATGKGTSVLEIVKTIEKVTGHKLGYELKERRPGDPDQLIADPTKINNEVGWHANFNLEDIIRDAWKWEEHRPQGDYA